MMTASQSPSDSKVWARATTSSAATPPRQWKRCRVDAGQHEQRHLDQERRVAEQLVGLGEEHRRAAAPREGEAGQRDGRARRASGASGRAAAPRRAARTAPGCRAAARCRRCGRPRAPGRPTDDAMPRRPAARSRSRARRTPGAREGLWRPVATPATTRRSVCAIDRSDARGCRRCAGSMPRCGRRTPPTAWLRRSAEASPRSAGSAARSRGSRRRRTSGRARARARSTDGRATALAPIALSGTSIVSVRSGVQSPMSQSCDTTRVPGASASRRGRSCRLTSGSRYIVTTVAGRGRSRTGPARGTRAVGDAGGACAFSRLLRTRAGTISTPRPRAPKRRAAVMTMRPSPEPRSMTWSRAARRELEHRQRHGVGRGDEGHLVGGAGGRRGQADERGGCHSVRGRRDGRDRRLARRVMEADGLRPARREDVVHRLGSAARRPTRPRATGSPASTSATPRATNPTSPPTPLRSPRSAVASSSAPDAS